MTYTIIIGDSNRCASVNGRKGGVRDPSRFIGGNEEYASRMVIEFFHSYFSHRRKAWQEKFNHRY